METPSSDSLVDAYNAVFSVHGGAPVIKTGKHTDYVEDLVRALVGTPAFQPLNLTAVRALPQSSLLRILFKAVAGNFVSGQTALRTDVCRLEADQVTGTIEVWRDGGENEVVLIVITLILLGVLVGMLYNREHS
jgi:hypothetical protein